MATDAEIDAFLTGQAAATPANEIAAPSPVDPTLTPKTDEALDSFLTNQTRQASMPTGQNVVDRGGGMASTREIEDSQFIRENQVPGVELDIESGLGWAARSGLAMRRLKTDQLKFLQNRFGKDKVRLSEDGDFIVRITQDGKEKDMLVDERKNTGKDVLDMLGDAPELVASIFAMRKGKLPAALERGKILGPALKGAIGFSAGGVVKDVATRTLDDASIRPGEILAKRTEQGVANTLFGAGFGILGQGVVGGINLLRRPLIQEAPGLVEQAGQLAAKTIEAETGVAIPSSVAEITGNRGLARLETFVSKVPGGRKIMERVARSRLAAHDQFQRVLMDGKDPKLASEVSQRAIKAIQAQTAPLEAAKATAKTELGATASAEVASVFPTVPSRTALELGETLATDAQGAYQAFKTQADDLYNAYRTTGGQDAVIAAGPLKQRAAQLLEELKVTTDQGKEVVQKLTPPDTVAFLESVSKLADDVPLAELRQIRTRLFESIGDPQILPGVGIGVKKQLAGAATNTIEKGVDALPNTAVKTTLQAANKFYREESPKFLENAIEGLLLPTTAAGASGRESFINSLYAGGRGSAETFSKLKTLFGDKSPQIQAVKDYFYDNVLEKITNPVTRTINMNEVIPVLERMAPELSKELFGANAPKALSAARAFMAGEGKVGFDEVKNLLQSGQPSSQKLVGLMKAQADLDKAYQNEIRKAVGEGKLTNVDADEFVNRYIFGGSTIKDLQETMKTFAMTSDAELVGDIQRKYLSSLFAKGQRTSSSTGDVTQENFTRGVLGMPQREIDPSKFSSLLDSAEEQARMQVVLGPKKAELMRNFALKLASEGEVRRKGGEAASLVAGGIMNNLITGLSGLSDVAKYRTVAYLLTHPTAYQFLTKNRPPVEWTGFIKAATLTPEFSKALIDDIPDPDEQMALAEELNRFNQQP